MNLVLLFDSDFIDNGKKVRLRGRRLTHVRDIHRVSPGSTLCVGLLGGRIGEGRVISLDNECLHMEVHLYQPPPRALPLTLVLALPRPKALKRTLIAATTLGIKRIVLLNAFRVEKSFWKSPALDMESIRSTLILGLEQARDTLLPDVLVHPLFKPFVEDELPGMAGGTLPLAAHPAAVEPCPRALQQPVTLAIGPEGGFIPYEIEKLVSIGFRIVHLGERILRVETALPALVSRIF
jgi:16S rRNA (uracil1498-N3)-methyltransferase